MHLSAERGQLLLVDACADHLHIRIDVRAALERLNRTINRLRMNARDRRIADVARCMNQARIDFRCTLIEVKPLQVRCNQLHAAVFNCHRLLNKIHIYTPSFTIYSLIQQMSVFPQMCAPCADSQGQDDQ